MDNEGFTANDGWYAKREEINAAVKMLYVWGGLRDRHLDADAIVAKMLVAAHNASHPVRN
jgi:hypothetical protein